MYSAFGVEHEIRKDYDQGYKAGSAVGDARHPRKRGMRNQNTWKRNATTGALVGAGAGIGGLAAEKQIRRAVPKVKAGAKTAYRVGKRPAKFVAVGAAVGGAAGAAHRHRESQRISGW